jgi:hypothetical protein
MNAVNSPATSACSSAACTSSNFPEFDALPVDPVGRADLAIRIPRTRAVLDDLDPSGALTDRAAEALAAAEVLPPAEDLVVVHGDLHVRHALIDAGGGLSGVIDWGDMCRTSASVDLSLYWSLFTPAARDAFRAAYGEISEATLARARVRDGPFRQPWLRRPARSRRLAGTGPAWPGLTDTSSLRAARLVAGSAAMRRPYLARRDGRFRLRAEARPARLSAGESSACS